LFPWQEALLSLLRGRTTIAKHKSPNENKKKKKKKEKSTFYLIYATCKYDAHIGDAYSMIGLAKVL